MTASRELRVETSTICNYACVMCAHSALRRRQELMPDALFEQIVAKALHDRPDLEICTVSGFGELAADPRWLHKLAVARARFARVHVVTNLSLVADTELDALAALATEVRVSIYGTDDETYRRVHRPQGSVRYETIAARIRTLAARRGPGFTLTLTCCELPQNRHQIAEWIATWRDVADRLEVWRPHNWVDGKRYREVCGERVASCGRPAGGPIQVQVDGTVNVCCFDYDGQLVVGDLRRQGLTEILDGEPLRRIRALHASGRADELALCAVCDQREPPARKAAQLLYCSDADPAVRVQRTSSAGETLPRVGAALADDEPATD